MTDDEMLPGGKFTGCERFYETNIRAPYRLLWIALHWLQVWGSQRPDTPAPSCLEISRDEDDGGRKTLILVAYRGGMVICHRIDVSQAIYPNLTLEATMLSIIDDLGSEVWS